MKKRIYRLILFSTSILCVVNLFGQNGTDNNTTGTATAVQTKEEVLTNASVINLFSKGLSSKIIVSKIKTSRTNFNVSTDSLIKLKEHSIPDDIINAMIDASGSKKEIAVDINDPMTPHESGIYYYNTQDGKNEMTLIEYTDCNQSTSGMAPVLTYGIAPMKTKSSINGSTSNYEIEDVKPIFYFYFTKSSDDAGDIYGLKNKSASPNEYVLIKLTIKQNSRVFTTGKTNTLSGNNSGFDKKQLIDFSFEKMKPGIYKVTPKKPLLKGEYCFVDAGGSTVMGMFMIKKVYDFGIK